MRLKLPLVITVLTLLSGPISTYAHHGFTVEFDPSKCMDLKGTLTGVLWENPHAYIRMDVKNAEGKLVSWSLEMVTPNALKRNGTLRQDFVDNFGKTINVRACPSRAEGDRKGAAEYLQLSDGEIRGVGQMVERLTEEQRHF